MKSVNYKQGMTTVYVDEEKIVIKNSSHKQYVPDNVDRIFGVGEWDKIYRVKYFEEEDTEQFNTFCKPYMVTSGYIPKRALEDLAKQSLPGTSENDLVDKYFDD